MAETVTETDRAMRDVIATAMKTVALAVTEAMDPDRFINGRDTRTRTAVGTLTGTEKGIATATDAKARSGGVLPIAVGAETRAAMKGTAGGRERTGITTVIETETGGQQAGVAVEARRVGCRTSTLDYPSRGPKATLSSVLRRTPPILLQFMFRPRSPLFANR